MKRKQLTDEQFNILCDFVRCYKSYLNEWELGFFKDILVLKASSDKQNKIIKNIIRTSKEKKRVSDLFTYV